MLIITTNKVPFVSWDLPIDWSAPTTILRFDQEVRTIFWESSFKDKLVDGSHSFSHWPLRLECECSFECLNGKRVKSECEKDHFKSNSLSASPFFGVGWSVWSGSTDLVAPYSGLRVERREREIENESPLGISCDSQSQKDFHLLWFQVGSKMVRQCPRHYVCTFALSLSSSFLVPFPLFWPCTSEVISKSSLLSFSLLFSSPYFTLRPVRSCMSVEHTYTHHEWVCNSSSGTWIDEDEPCKAVSTVSNRGKEIQFSYGNLLFL